MKITLAPLWRFVLFAGLTLPAVFAAKDKGLDVLISSDAIESPEGFRPKPGKPVHYLLSQNRQTLGDVIAGVKLPDAALVENAVVAELRKQGFVRTDVGGPVPDIVIVATIGDANFEQPRWIPGTNPYYEPDFEPYLRQVNIQQALKFNIYNVTVTAETTLEEIFEIPPFKSTMSGPKPEAQELMVAAAVRIRERNSDRGKDRPKIMALVGAGKVEKAVAEHTLGGVDAERIAYAARNNQLYVTLTAFDANAWRKKQKVVLWRTTMLIDWREDFSKALPQMLAQAGPVFGTDVAVPGFVNTAKPREGKVEVGEARVVNDKDAASPSGAKK